MGAAILGDAVCSLGTRDPGEARVCGTPNGVLELLGLFVQLRGSDGAALSGRYRMTIPLRL